MKTYNIKEISARIRVLRRAHGYTQEELAMQLGTDKSYLGHVERGQRGCSIDILVQLSEIFGISLDYLVLGSEAGPSVKGKLNEVIQQLIKLRDSC